MTLKELAQLLGHTAHSHVSELETGKRKPSLDVAVTISHLFNVSVDRLVKDELDLED